MRHNICRTDPAPHRRFFSALVMSIDITWILWLQPTDITKSFYRCCTVVENFFDQTHEMCTGRQQMERTICSNLSSSVHSGACNSMRKLLDGPTHGVFVILCQSKLQSGITHHGKLRIFTYNPKENKREQKKTRDGTSLNEGGTGGDTSRKAYTEHHDSKTEDQGNKTGWWLNCKNYEAERNSGLCNCPKRVAQQVKGDKTSRKQGDTCKGALLGTDD